MHNLVRNRRAALSIVAGISVLAMLNYTPVPAQQPQLPMFENATINPNFSPDPLTIRGISGGTVPAKNLAERAETSTGACVGFVDQQPDHTLVVTDFFNYLSIQVQSPNDTTLIVRGPGGSWCNDDSEGKNPGLGGQWLAGTYRIWVGSYDQTKYHPYILRITKKRLANDD